MKYSLTCYCLLAYAHYITLWLLLLSLQRYWFKWHIAKTCCWRHFTKWQKCNVPINNIHLAKQQVRQVSFSKSSEHQQGVRTFYLGRQTVPGAQRCNRERSVSFIAAMHTTHKSAWQAAYSAELCYRDAYTEHRTQCSQSAETIMIITMKVNLYSTLSWSSKHF